MNKDTIRLSTDRMFHTLQGEGLYVGTPTVFVRMDLCNLRCKWGDTYCDAAYTSWTPNGDDYKIGDVAEEVLGLCTKMNCHHVVITGGEPYLQPKALQKLCRELFGMYITIETNGTKYTATSADLICLSPKLSSSIPKGTNYERMHHARRWEPKIVQRLMESTEYYFKFVINSDEDIREVMDMLAELGQHHNDPQRVFLMPQGVDVNTLQENGRMVAEWCKRLGMRYSPRLQIDLWGNTPGT